MYDCDLNNYVDNTFLGVCYDGNIHIHLAMHKPTNSHIIMKKYNIDFMGDEDYALIREEIRRTRQLKHPNVLPYLYSFISGHSVYVLSPLMHYGSCSRLIEEYFTHGLPELAIAFIIRDVLRGLDYIHKRGIIHRAIKANHILISALGQVCISGLRYAFEVVKNGKWQKNVFSFPKSTIYNLTWLSPEVLLQNIHGYNQKSDIYSVGVAICEIANGVEPYREMPVTLMLTEKVHDSPPHLIDRTNIPLDSYEIDETKTDEDNEKSRKRFEALSGRQFSDEFHNFTETCLLRDPIDRPSLWQLQKHEFFKQCRKSDKTLLDVLKSVPIMQDNVANSHDGFECDLATSIESMAHLNTNSCLWDFGEE